MYSWKTKTHCWSQYFGQLTGTRNTQCPRTIFSLRYSFYSVPWSTISVDKTLCNICSFFLKSWSQTMKGKVKPMCSEQHYIGMSDVLLLFLYVYTPTHSPNSCPQELQCFPHNLQLHSCFQAVWFFSLQYYKAATCVWFFDWCSFFNVEIQTILGIPVNCVGFLSEPSFSKTCWDDLHTSANRIFSFACVCHDMRFPMRLNSGVNSVSKFGSGCISLEN